MNVTRESDSPTEITFNISMDAEDEEPFLNRSYRRVVSRLQIPGFRPGKAPRSIVESHVGRTALVQEALEFMIPESLDRVLREHEIQAFTEPRLEVLDLEPVSFKAVVPLEPEIDLGEFRSIRLESVAVEIGQEDVDRVLEDLRYESAPWEPAERPLAFGDLATLNVQGVIAGEDAIDDQGIDFIPTLENPLPIPGFSVYLEGMTEGQQKSFSLSVPDDHHQGEYAGKECRFEVEVVAVKEKRLPELDDEFAKGVREGFESLEALTAHIRQRLQEEGESTAQRQLEANSLDEVMKLATIRASDLIYERELESMREDQEQALRRQRLDMDTYLRYMGQTEDQWQEMARPQAEQRLKTFLVIRKLAEEEGLEVAAAEIEEEVERLMEGSPEESGAAIRQAFNTGNARDSIRTSLLNRKVMARLTEIVQGNDETAQAEESDADAGPEAGQPESAESRDTGDNDTGDGETLPESRETGSDDTGDGETLSESQDTGDGETGSDETGDGETAAETEGPA